MDPFEHGAPVLIHIIKGLQKKPLEESLNFGFLVAATDFTSELSLELQDQNVKKSSSRIPIAWKDQWQCDFPEQSVLGQVYSIQASHRQTSKRLLSTSFSLISTEYGRTDKLASRHICIWRASKGIVTAMPWVARTRLAWISGGL